MTRNDTWLLKPGLPEMAPDIALHHLIDTHGVARTLAALVRVLTTRRRVKAEIAHMSGHLRRDIGLPEAAPEPARLPLHLGF